jgi:hypothetical protein
MERKTIRINVAVDSIIYAPLYAFVEKTSNDNTSKFNFLINPTSDPPRLQTPHDLSGLSPIIYDPTFSPVIDRTIIKKDKDLLFGVGDPLRIKRLVLSKGNSISDNHYDFLGTLVSKPALWLVIEHKCISNLTNIANYNYVGCHSEGMTGYYLSEIIFKRKGNNPLAPVNHAGTELECWDYILEADNKRRQGRNGVVDPVWLAAVSTEIDEAIYRKEKSYHNGESPMYYFLPEEFNIIPKDFLFTAIVARKPQEKATQALIDDAKDVLIQGLSEIIEKVNSGNGHQEVADHLYEFYNARTSFSLPKYSTKKSEQMQFIHQILNILETKEIYPYDLRASVSAKQETDRILKQCIRSEIKAKGLTKEENRQLFTRYFEELKTDKWKEGLWVT